MISLIAAIGANRELGRKGELIFHIPEDMKFFRETTMGHKVVMGRKTWESLPGKLQGRENIVISRGEVEGADEVVRDLTTYLIEHQQTEEEIFVIGGGMIYRAALPYAEVLYLTEVNAREPEADTFFPDFDKNQYKKEILKEGKENELEYAISKYTRK